MLAYCQGDWFYLVERAKREKKFRENSTQIDRIYGKMVLTVMAISKPRFPHKFSEFHALSYFVLEDLPAAAPRSC